VSPFAEVFSRVGYTLAGLVAGEGSFIITRKLPAFANGDRRLRFVFTMTMAQRDRALLEALRTTRAFGAMLVGRT